MAGERLLRSLGPAPPWPRLQVHVNELLGGAETSAYLVKYDSVHGTRSMSISREPGCLLAASIQLESRV